MLSLNEILNKDKNCTIHFGIVYSVGCDESNHCFLTTKEQDAIEFARFKPEYKVFSLKSGFVISDEKLYILYPNYNVFSTENVITEKMKLRNEVLSKLTQEERNALKE